jgi:hypothetical protein
MPITILSARTQVALAVCASIWLVLHIILLVKFGARTAVDSELYITDALNLLKGKLPEGRSIWYFSYSLFLASIFFLNGGNLSIVILQITLSGVAACCIFKTALHLFKTERVAILSALLYVSWFKIHEWNTILYTESLFTSCSIILFFLIITCSRNLHYVSIGLLLLFTFFIRPTGFALLLGLFSYLIFSIKGSYSKRATLLSSLFACLVGSFVVSNMLVSFPLIDSYVKAEIIYPNISLGLKPPSTLYIPESDHPTLIRVLSFAVHNPIYSLKLFSFKLLLFLGNIKPYFSATHNVIIVLTLYPLYFFAVKGFLAFPKERKERFFIISFVFVQAIIVGLTSENWDGRFLVPLLPFIFLLSANGINSIYTTRLTKGNTLENTEANSKQF